MFQENVPLAAYSNYKIGGPARFFILAKTVPDVLLAIEQAKRLGLSIFILGGGTNLLISDTGFPGVMIKSAFAKLEQTNKTFITVGAGVLVNDLLQFCITNEFSGLEWAGGLPGTVGGAVWGNAGAFKGEIKDSVKEVVSVDLKNGVFMKRTNAECQFGYRTSIFKERAQKGEQEVIIEIVFALTKGIRAEIVQVINEKIEYRKARQPLEYPNIGSIFKNIDIKRVPAETLKKFELKIKTDPFPVLPTAVLIDAAGLKGKTIGGAMISPKHPNFIVNVKNASAQDVKTLMTLIQTDLKKQFGVSLEQEVIFV